MENIEIVEKANPFDGNTYEYVIIDRGDGEFTSMLKADFDKQAEQSTPNLAP
jgi:hypothetical protein